MPRELVLPIANLQRLARVAGRAAHIKPISDRPGHTRRAPAVEKVLIATDEHPWGEVQWALYPTDYLTAHRCKNDPDVWQYFYPVRLTVRHPQHAVRRDHTTSAARSMLPSGRPEWRAVSIGLGSGAAAAAATLAADLAAGPVWWPVSVSVYGIAATMPFLGLTAHRYKNARTVWLTDDAQKRKQLDAARHQRRDDPAMPPDVLVAFAAAADVWQHVIALEHKPASLLAHLTTLHGVACEKVNYPTLRFCLAP